MFIYHLLFFFFFFFNDPATTEIYTLSLHDALPILNTGACISTGPSVTPSTVYVGTHEGHILADRKSTRLNSSHVEISYAVFCLKKKKKNIYDEHIDLIKTNAVWSA